MELKPDWYFTATHDDQLLPHMPSFPPGYPGGGFYCTPPASSSGPSVPPGLDAFFDHIDRTGTTAVAFHIPPQ